MIKAIFNNSDIWHNTSELIEFLGVDFDKKCDDSWADGGTLYFEVKYVEGQLAINVERLSVDYTISCDGKTFRKTIEFEDFTRNIEVEFHEDAETYAKDKYMRLNIFPRQVDIDFKNTEYTTVFTIK